jgi:hypothetical protein
MPPKNGGYSSSWERLIGFSFDWVYPVHMSSVSFLIGSIESVMRSISFSIRSIQSVMRSVSFSVRSIHSRSVMRSFHFQLGLSGLLQDQFHFQLGLSVCYEISFIFNSVYIQSIMRSVSFSIGSIQSIWDQFMASNWPHNKLDLGKTSPENRCNRFFYIVAPILIGQSLLPLATHVLYRIV